LRTLCVIARGNGVRKRTAYGNFARDFWRLQIGIGNFRHDARRRIFPIARDHILKKSQDRGARESAKRHRVAGDVVRCRTRGFVGGVGGDEPGIAQAFPFFEQAGVDAANEFAEIVFHLYDGSVLAVSGTVCVSTFQTCERWRSRRPSERSSPYSRT